MNDEQPTADDGTERDGERDPRGERSSAEPPQFGITDEDMEQIQSFIAKQRHQRSVDDLRPSQKR